MLSPLSATTRFLGSRNRLSVLQRAVDHWRFINSTSLPEVFLVDAFPETRGRAVAVSADVCHTFELPYGERLVVAAIVSALAPKVVFEFGTFTGATTALIAESCPPTSIIHTLDLPASELIGTEVVDADIGSRFKDDLRYSTRIIQHRSNSRQFDYSTLIRTIDFVYIDGSHKFSDVLADSRIAVKMLSGNGVIVWDDYQLSAMPVAAALNVLSKEFHLERIFGTRLVVHRAGWPLQRS
jgi:hypothetical protein